MSKTKRFPLAPGMYAVDSSSAGPTGKSLKLKADRDYDFCKNIDFATLERAMIRPAIVTEEKEMKTFETALKDYLEFHRSVHKAVESYCEASEDSNLQYWVSFLIEECGGKTEVEIYWNFPPQYYGDDDDSGFVTVPLDDLLPLIKTQWEFDEFDRRLSGSKEEKEDV